MHQLSNKFVIIMLAACASLAGSISVANPPPASTRSQPVTLDGSNISGGLTQAPDGTIYGATQAGGRSRCAGEWGSRPGGNLGCGTIFRIHPDGQAETLYYFRGGQDGVGPQGLGVTPGGELIGMSWVQGDPRYRAKVFRLSPTGAMIVLTEAESPADHGDMAWDGHEFIGIANGKVPFYTLSLTGDIHLLDLPAPIKARCGTPIGLGDGDEDISYGPTSGLDGAAFATTEKCVVYLAEPPEGIKVVAYSSRFRFVNAPIFDPAGNMYVAAWLVGMRDGSNLARDKEGVILINRSGEQTILATLPRPDEYADANYITGFVMGQGSIIYGVAYIGGRFGAGMLFSVDMEGTLVDLHDFCPGNLSGREKFHIDCNDDGPAPFANLLAARDGTIWGSSDYGVFEYRPKSKRFSYVIRFNGR